MDDYELLDSGHGQKLERFGPVLLIRPCAQAVWAPRCPELWESATASFDRKDGLNWHGRERLPETWTITVREVRMQLSTTDFGHLGIFPKPWTCGIRFVVMCRRLKKSAIVLPGF